MVEAVDLQKRTTSRDISSYMIVHYFHSLTFCSARSFASGGVCGEPVEDGVVTLRAPVDGETGSRCDVSFESSVGVVGEPFTVFVGFRSDEERTSFVCFEQLSAVASFAAAAARSSSLSKGLRSCRRVMSAHSSSSALAAGALEPSAAVDAVMCERTLVGEI